jgi:hypothetical protein
MTRDNVIPLLLGIILGFFIGVLYAWVISPVEYVDTAPKSLREDFRQDYLALISSAYASTGDILRARARLELFSDPNAAQTLAQLAQQRLAAGWPRSEIEAIAKLAADLMGDAPSSTSTAIPQTTLPTPTSTPTARSSPTPRPSSTSRPTATAGLPFEVLAVSELCDPDLEDPFILVEVLDAAEEPVSGIEIVVYWDEGEDHFYTGLKPEMGMGYADYQMAVDFNYSLQLMDASPLVTDLEYFICSDEEGANFPGSWFIQFQQPTLSP